MTTTAAYLPALFLVAITRQLAAQDNCPAPLYGVWSLTFASQELTHEATLKMNGCDGIMEVAFFDRGHTVQIAEPMTERQLSWGIRLGGRSPVFRGTAIPADSIYAPDNLYYSVSAQGDTSFTNCDLQTPPQCSPVELVSSRLATIVKLRNECDVDVEVAVLYKTPDDRWVRKGWLVVEPDGESGIATLNPYVYIYAQGAGRYWTGEGRPYSVSRLVVDNAFELNDSLPLYGTGLRTVSFRRVEIDPSRAVYTHGLTCT